ncbi:hypothetical protein BDV97DRAFT_419936 [Delphinella strobiligena]|nr:hypothetical protein BDV97DRAFT_419936 [Delphinella strobiligena]
MDMSQAADESAVYPIMDLSPEVRQMIYRFAIAKEVEDERKHIKSEQDEYLLAHQGRLCRLNLKQPAITRVSKLVRQESLSLFYRETRFVACSILHNNHGQIIRVLCEHSFAFLNAVTDQNLLDIRNLDVLIYNPVAAPPPPPPPPPPPLPAVPAVPPLANLANFFVAVIATAAAPPATLPFLKLSFNITSRRVPATNVPASGPIVPSMSTTIGPTDKLPVLAARLNER